MNKRIKQLVNYGIENNLISEFDRGYVTNLLIDVLGMSAYTEAGEVEKADLCEILGDMCDYAVENGIIEDGIASRDLFDTKIMGILTPVPHEVIAKFRELYKTDPKAATDYFYNMQKAVNYIRVDRIARDAKWETETDYGTLDITINLSKPEKDPKAIAAAKNAKSVGYPKCMLCVENEGYAGRLDFPARQNHRTIPIEINGRAWRMQYSPYVYYNEHCIVFNEQHTPMCINTDTFRKLLSFVEQFPHYFVGSNADLPIVGGSILSHDHFQGGNYTFAMAKAPIEKAVSFAGFGEIEAGIVKWPMSVIRLRSDSTERLVALAEKILLAWRSYTDEEAYIFAETDGEPHNTITPIARKTDKYELDLVLRCNITSEEHPMGVYHPHAELHHIKKENIGLIEVMGLAVLPARLKDELAAVEKALVTGEDMTKNQLTASHAKWAQEIKSRYNITEQNVSDIVKAEVGAVFSKVLEHAGVYARNQKGMEQFLKFIESVK